jgi:hypothetical protein
MGLFKRLLEEASDDAIRWIGSIANKMGTTPESIYRQVGDYPEKLFLQAPQMFKFFEPLDLFDIMSEAKRGYSDLTLMPTEVFRDLAAQINPAVKEMSDEKVRNFMDLIEQGIALDTSKSGMPVLTYTNPIGEVVQITGHDSRHRTRALERLGEPYQLVRMIPEQGAARVSEISPEAKVYTEQSPMQMEGKGGKLYGALGELMKILGLVSVPAGALTMQKEGKDKE